MRARGARSWPPFHPRPSKAERWEPAIRRIAEELVDDMTARGIGDVVHDVALPLPLRMISAVFGDLDEDYERLRYLVGRRCRALGGSDVGG
jgi:cytochrome P450